MATSLPAREFLSIPAHDGAVLALTYNSDGNYAISGGRDKIIRLWNTEKGTLIKEYSGAHGYEVRDIACSHDNSRMASCGGDRTVFVTEIATSRVIRRFARHEQLVNAVAFNADDSVLLSASYDRTVCAWDMRSQSRDPIISLADAKDSVTRVVSTDTEILTSSVDGCIRVYDMRAGRLTTDHMGEAITCLRVSADGNCVLVSLLNSTIRLFDRSNSDLLNEYKSKEFVNDKFQIDSCFAQDDAVVLSGAEDGIIRCWDLVSGELLKKLPGHKGVVIRLAAHPTQNQLISAGNDGAIKIWRS
uniref:Uncharacterized protein n=1 Tax=Spongospora subterranea TaxID=70186 RepID=A0A0H5RC81_9EUKA|eukprot:CRZ11212.1 hypothetical protein [Spongospora subterranea]